MNIFTKALLNNVKFSKNTFEVEAEVTALPCSRKAAKMLIKRISIFDKEHYTKFTK